MSPEGVVRAGEPFFMRVKFDCGMASSQLKHSWQVFLRLQLFNIHNGAPFDDIGLPLSKICFPDSKGWLSDGFGTEDDWGHFGAFLPYVIYGILVFFSSLERGAQCLRNTGDSSWSYRHLLVRALSPYGLGSQNGLLETLMLLVGGFVNFVAHSRTWYSGTNMSPDWHVHELFHLSSSVFCFSMGILSCVLHQRLRSMIHFALPLFIVCLAVLFTLHTQGTAHSNAIHQVYSIITALSGICRFCVYVDTRLGLPAGFLFIWAGFILLISAKGAEASMVALQMDAAAGVFAAGILSSVVCIVIVLCTEGHQNRGKEALAGNCERCAWPFCARASFGGYAPVDGNDMAVTIGSVAEPAEC
jgi:hypothetical protein